MIKPAGTIGTQRQYKGFNENLDRKQTSKRFTYLRSVIEKIGEIQKEIHDRIRKDSQFYHLINSILCKKDTGRKCKTTIHKV
jgi:hypothetical protein